MKGASFLFLSQFWSCVRGNTGMSSNQDGRVKRHRAASTARGTRESLCVFLSGGQRPDLVSADLANPDLQRGHGKTGKSKNSMCSLCFNEESVPITGLAGCFMALFELDTVPTNPGRLPCFYRLIRVQYRVGHSY